MDGKLFCPLFLNKVHKNTKDELIQNLNGPTGCIVQWKPGSFKAHHCIDKTKIISTCKQFSKNSTSDLVNLCHGVFSPVKGFRGIYRNVFCLRCNADEYDYGHDNTNICPHTDKTTFKAILDTAPVPAALSDDADVCKPT